VAPRRVDRLRRHRSDRGRLSPPEDLEQPRPGRAGVERCRDQGLGRGGHLARHRGLHL